MLSQIPIPELDPKSDSEVAASQTYSYSAAPAALITSTVPNIPPGFKCEQPEPDSELKVKVERSPAPTKVENNTSQLEVTTSNMPPPSVTQLDTHLAGSPASKEVGVVGHMPPASQPTYYSQQYLPPHAMQYAYYPPVYPPGSSYLVTPECQSYAYLMPSQSSPPPQATASHPGTNYYYPYSFPPGTPGSVGPSQTHLYVAGPSQQDIKVNVCSLLCYMCHLNINIISHSLHLKSPAPLVLRRPSS